MVREGLHRYHASALRHAKSQRNKEIRDGVGIRSSGHFIPSYIRFVKSLELAIVYGLSPTTFWSHWTPTGFAPSHYHFHMQREIGSPEITENNLMNTQETQQTALADLILFNIRTLSLLTDEWDHPEAI